MDNIFIRVDEVAQELSVSKPYAYKLIKKLNDELKEQGVYYDCGACQPPVFPRKVLRGRRKTGKGDGVNASI